MTKDEALQWIIDQDMTQFELSPIILEDIRSKTTKVIE
jgi:hypothetical protein